MESRGIGGHALVMVKRLELGRWDVANGILETPAILPVDPLPGGELYLVKQPRGAALADDLGLVQAIHRLGQRVCHTSPT